MWVMDRDTLRLGRAFQMLGAVTMPRTDIGLWPQSYPAGTWIVDVDSHRRLFLMPDEFTEQFLPVFEPPSEEAVA